GRQRGLPFSAAPSKSAPTFRATSRRTFPVGCGLWRTPTPEAPVDPTTTLQAVQAWPVEQQVEFLFRAWDQVLDSGWRPELTYPPSRGTAMPRLLPLLPACLLAALCLRPARADDRDELKVGVQPDGRIVVPTNQVLTPAGAQVTFPGRPVDLAFADGGKTLVV